MQHLRGIGVSAGIVVGKAYVVEDRGRGDVRRRRILADRAEAEVDRFRRARRLSEQELREIYERAIAEMGEEAAKIFLFHVAALSDPSVTGPIEQKIRDELVTADYAVWSVFSELAARLEQGSGEMSAKATDLKDLSARVLDHLVGAQRSAVATLDHPTVIVSRDLTPSQAASFDTSRVLGFATDLGGSTSHTAIVARALGLPAVVGCRALMSLVSDGDLIAVDGERGTVVVDPDGAALDEHRARLAEDQARTRALAELSGLPPETRDGQRVELLGNIEFPDEVDRVLEAGGEGVGLYRTEFLYLTSELEPDESTQHAAYARCVELLGGRTLTIRTMDLGADKHTQALSEEPERNPFLGLRSIRYCLHNVGLFKTQLRAILRASADGPVKIMFPLVTSVQEFRNAKHLLHDVMEDLQDEGVPFDRAVPVGMMVETPSAALMAGSFAREVDFFSVGTNDLVQYALAVDRTNERVASLYQPCHPAVVKLVRDVVRAGRRHGVPVSCCGEAAAEPGFAAVLLGLGVRTLSATAANLPGLKRLVRGVSIQECERIAKRVVQFDSEHDAASFVRDRVRKLVPEAFEGRESVG
mgnify:FL=1